jgi:molybdate transport system substrate-binding protein
MALSARVLLIGLAFAAALASCRKSNADRGEVVVFAAASLRESVAEIAKDYEAQNPKIRVVQNFAGSNELAQQILATPKADLFVSASEEWMDRLEKGGRVEAGTRRLLLSNRLVIVAGRESALSIASAEDLATARYRHLVLANPDAVPAGQYAKKYLESRGLWSKVEARVLPMPDVRAALAQAERQAEVVAIVYATDARASKQVKVLFEIPPAEAPKIGYPVALIAGRPNREAARGFYDRLVSDRALKVFEARGFSRPE